MMTAVLQGFLHSAIASSKLCKPARSLREESNETERMFLLSISVESAASLARALAEQRASNIKSLSVHHALLYKNTIERDVIDKNKLNVPKVNLT